MCRNPTKGIIKNQPLGGNVYDGVLKDYTKAVSSYSWWTDGTLSIFKRVNTCIAAVDRMFWRCKMLILPKCIQICPNLITFSKFRPNPTRGATRILLRGGLETEKKNCDVILWCTLGDVIWLRHQNDVINWYFEVLLRHNYF